MTASKTTIYRGNEDNDRKRKESRKVRLATVVAVVALLAAKLYFLWAWRW